MADKKVFKDLQLNGEITVTFKVADVICAIAEYGNAEWSGSATTAIMAALHREVLHPLFLSEQEAALQHQRDMQEVAARKFLGDIPDLPPNMTEEGL